MSPDWSAAGPETVSRLQDLLRFDTTNPPGKELPVARYLEAALKSEGIETTMFKPVSNRANLIGRISGTGAARPVILLAHMDVVGVERESWSCDPFGGEIRDGYVYGRGAIDDKGMLAANLMTMLLLQRELKRNGARLSRDVVFVATSDEEAGGEWGMGWLVEHHPDVLDAEFALNEGGRTRITEDGQTYLAIQAAEKISHVVTVTAHGSAGHAAIPLEDNAIFNLARALERLSHYSEPVVLTEITRQFFGGLAKVWPDATERKAMLDVASSDTRAVASGAAVLSHTAIFNAVLRNGISPTVLNGGNQFNVIPASAGAVLNVRTLPGQSLDAAVDRIHEAIGDATVTVEVTHRGEEAPASDPDSAMFAAIAETARALNPEIAVVPYLSTGVTDSARLRRLGIECYGVLPFPMDYSDEQRMHGHDERVSVESLHFGTRLIHGTITRIAG